MKELRLQRPYSLFLEEVIFRSPQCELNLGGSTPAFPFSAGFFNEMPVSIVQAAFSTERVELQSLLATRFGCEFDEFVFSLGSSMALLQVLAAITKAGDTVLIEDPHYEPFVKQAQILGLKVRLFKRSNDPEKDLKEIKKKKRGVRVLLITNPHAPIGKSYSREFMNELAALFPFLIVDEVFRPLFSADGNWSVWKKELPSNVITLHSFSKSVGLSSIRVGFSRSDKKLARLIDLQGNLFHIDVPTPSLLYAREVVKKWDTVITAMDANLVHGRQSAQSFYQEYPKYLSHDFRYGFFGMLKAPAKLKTGQKLSNEMLKHGIYVRPGDLLRMPNWVRFHIFMTPEQNTKFWGILNDLYS